MWRGLIATFGVPDLAPHYPDQAEHCHCAPQGKASFSANSNTRSTGRDLVVGYLVRKLAMIATYRASMSPSFWGGQNTLLFALGHHRIVNADAIADAPNVEAQEEFVALVVRINEVASSRKLIDGQTC